MKLKAIWNAKNPFNPDISQLGYTKTVDVPDDTDMEVLKQFAIKDSKTGYVFKKFEIINSPD